MIATVDTPRCTAEEWEQFRRMVAHGMLFEVLEWIDQGKPTLRPENKHTSAFESAVMAPNLSMTQVLWERAWQERREAASALGSLAWHRTSDVVMRYLLEKECPVDHVSGFELCLFHDLEMVNLGMSRGVSLLEPDGWASAFVRVGSRPLIRLYLEQRDKIPELKKDAIRALCKCIAESRLRATALLVWAGVDPLGKAPRYYDLDDEEEEWDGFPALYVAQAEKAGELMKLLKLKPTTEQWFDLLEASLVRRAECIRDVMALRRDPDAVFRENTERTAALLRRILRSLCWGWGWQPARDESIMDFCIQLLEKGAQLWWKDRNEIASCRRDIYRTNNQRLVFKVLSVAAERAQDRSKTQMAELVRAAKMRELTIQKDPMILRHLGLPGPADYMSFSQSSRREQQRNRIGTVTVQTQNRAESETELPHRSIDPPVPVKPKPISGHLFKRKGSRVLNREEIYAEVWAEAAMHVAKRYGISGSMLARICTQLRIPRPPRGYWARPAKARKGMKLPLPPWTSDQEACWAINPINVMAQKRERT